MKQYQYYSVEDKTIGKVPSRLPDPSDVDVEIVFYIIDSLDEEGPPGIPLEKDQMDTPSITSGQTIYSRDIQQTRTLWLNHFNLKEINQKLKELAYELMQNDQTNTSKLLGVSSRNISHWTKRQS